MQAESTAIFNAITECNRKFMSAFHQSDAQQIAELYTSDAMLLPPGSPPITGYSAIEGFWGDILQKGLSRLELKTLELEHLGYTAIEIGRAQLLTEAGEVAAAPKYLVVWVDAGNGWKLHRDIWNMDTA
jgi:ketosteroid isomerase-like protein